MVSFQGFKPRLRLVPVVAVSILLLTACDGTQPESQPDYVGVCVHPVTEVRLDDDACGDFDETGHAQHSGGMFIWLQSSQTHPIAPVGQRQARSTGSLTIPPGKAVTKGAPVAGAQSVRSVQRGGFGVSGGKAASGNTGGKSGGS